MIWSILLAIYVLVAMAIFCHLVHSWYTESKNGIGFSDIFSALMVGAVWPGVAPFWIWFKVENWLWDRKH